MPFPDFASAVVAFDIAQAGHIESKRGIISFDNKTANEEPIIGDILDLQAQ